MRNVVMLSVVTCSAIVVSAVGLYVLRGGYVLMGAFPAAFGLTTGLVYLRRTGAGR